MNTCTTHWLHLSMGGILVTGVLPLVVKADACG